MFDWKNSQILKLITTITIVFLELCSEESYLKAGLSLYLLRMRDILIARNLHTKNKKEMSRTHLIRATNCTSQFTVCIIEKNTNVFFELFEF